MGLGVARALAYPFRCYNPIEILTDDDAVTLDLYFILDGAAYLDLSIGSSGWLFWLFLFVIVMLVMRKWKHDRPSWGKREWGLFFSLLILAPITNALLPGLQISTPGALPPPMLPKDVGGAILMPFGALPWMLAGGLLGTTAAASLGFVSGLMAALWGTHSPFLSIETALMATLFAAAMQQRYRTAFYRLLRHPLAAAMLLGAIYPLLFLTGLTFTSAGNLANRLDYALTHVGVNALAMGASLVMAGIFSEVVSRYWPHRWGNQAPTAPSPAEKSLEARFIYSMLPLVAVLALALMAGDWIVAGRAARQMLEGRMANAAQMAVDSVPFFFESGQNLISQFADDPQLFNDPPEVVTEILSQHLRRVPYFSQLILLDDQGVLVTSYPPLAQEELVLAPEEIIGMDIARGGVPIQNYAIPPKTGSRTAQISFLAAVIDADEQLLGVLIGRSDLASNPFGQPLLTSLESVASIEGTGLLLDQNGRILHHPIPDMVMSQYTGERPESAQFFSDNAPDGTRQYVYYQPVSGRDWAVVLTAPSRYVQQQALDIATPLLVMIFFLSLVGFGLVRFGLSFVTASLHELAIEARRMASGKLDQSLQIDGEDEVSQLGGAFEKMRSGLKARMDELNRLLVVSQGVASSLELEDSLKPVLESALVTGASSARVVLEHSIMPTSVENPPPTQFGSGPASEIYRQLDDQILTLLRNQDCVQLTSLTRPRILSIPQGSPHPQSIIAIALRREQRYFGALWVGYDEPRQFSEDEVRFITTLGGQAALAAANASLFLSTEIGRQQLETILATIPDPVLVTGYHHRLILANTAARQMLGLDGVSGNNQPIDEVIRDEKLLQLFYSQIDEKHTEELVLEDGRIYLATISSMTAESQNTGRVCVLRDVTHFKEVDALKSEFVSTVSHDLRHPLTLIQGYATMLQRVGELNEHQAGYVSKIVKGVENMSHLVNNLLDLSRIEAGVGLQLEVVRVRDVVEQVIAGLQLEAAQKRIMLSSEIPQHNLPLLEADQALLQQALHNLINNAIKYTDNAGEVCVRLQVKPTEMVFEVRDTGIGIAPADLPRLFEKFYRSNIRGLNGERGSGLGLAIVKSVAERHGGRVWAESQLGKGSTFHLALPIRKPV